MILVTRRIKWKLFFIRKEGKGQNSSFDFQSWSNTQNYYWEHEANLQKNKSHVIQNIYEATYKNVIIHCRVLLQEPKTWKWCKKKNTRNIQMQNM